MTMLLWHDWTTFPWSDDSQWQMTLLGLFTQQS